jgi:TP901 family phage tail tape measure protein
VSDFQVSVGGDFQELLRGFQQLEARAQQAGQNVGKGIGEGIQGFSSRSLAALNQELNRLQSRQTRVDVNSEAFAKAGAKIREVQGLIDAVQRKQATIGVDDRSLVGLQSRLNELQNRQTKVSVDSTEFADLQREINKLEAEISDISGKKLLINADANSVLAVTSKLQSELDRLQQRQLRIDVDGQEFVDLGREIDRVQEELSTLERKRTQVTVDDRSLAAVQQRLSDLQTRQTKVSVDSSEFRSLQRQIDATEQELAEISRKKVLINVDGNSITAQTLKLQSELDRLQQRQLRIDVDDREFAALGQQINQLQEELADVERKRLLVSVDAKSVTALQVQLQTLQARQTRLGVDSSEFEVVTREINRLQEELAEIDRRRLLINADPSSLVALRTQLSGLQGELERVAIGSQRFRELKDAIESTERELAKAGEAADGFGLIDGAIQGLAFSLTNTVTDAAGRALQSVMALVSGFAQLDTEIRLAAAAAGEGGGYERIARSIDTVGIEAAGTQMQVAQLATELIRGGMTVEQMNASLGAIVRGAEATGTGFAQMGSVVSASLKGFGLQAEDARRIVDALVQGANASAASVDGMGMAFKYAAPVARILGVSVEDLGIAVGLLTNAGIDASEAGVTLRNGLSKLASAAPQTGGGMQTLTGQSKMAADAMKQLGINIYNADGTLRPMQETLLTLKGAFDKLGPASKIRLAANLFGGEDDGTKWLALLNQSEEEIKRMATTMANTKGATDTARDAMQGFQMAMNELTGTLDVLGATLGGVAAGALRPLVELASNALGVIVGMPTPIKAVGAALILVAGAATAATAAVVIFQRAMTVTAVQSAAREIGLLAVAFGTTLKGAIAATAAAIPGLIAQISLIGKINVGATISTLATMLKVTLVGAIKAVVAALMSINWSALWAGIKTTVAALGPMVIGLAAATTGIRAFLHVLNGSKDAANVFAEAQEQADKAVSGLTGSIEKATTAMKPWWQRMLEGLPIIGDFIFAVKNARQEMMELGGAEAFADLQGSFTRVQQSAIKFFNTIKEGSAVTAAQTAEAKKYIESLKKIASSADSSAQAIRAKAEAEDRAGNTNYAAQLRAQADALDADARAARGLSAALSQQAGVSSAATAATAEQTGATEQQTAAVKARAEAEAGLNRVIAEAPVRRLDAQLALGTQLVGIAKALADAEQSRFAVVKSGLQFELQALERRGASEQVLAAKRAEIAAADQAALSARYRALTQQQALEQVMLQLSQERARSEASLEVLEQRLAIKRAEGELAKATTTEERAAAEAQIALQRQILDVTIQKAAILAQTQPIEAAIAAAAAETARNGLQAQAAAEGFRITADGALVPVRGIATALRDVEIVTGLSADGQERLRQAIERSGLAISQAADGSLVLGRNQEQVGRAVGGLNAELSKGRAAVDATGKAAAALGRGIANAANPAGALEGAFTKTGKAAPAIVQGSRDFAAFLSGARSSGQAIERLSLDSKFRSVATSMGTAANDARSFYDWLRLAAALPGARWTGGPVEAGGEYRINELGQEAFLSAGRLALIDRPQNSIWRAPSSGVVIPAGVTSRLQEAGVLSAGGGSPAGVADLAIEVGKLRQEVGNLARRDWNIHVQQRTGPTASQVMNQIHRLR